MFHIIIYVNDDVYLWWENIGKVKLSNGNRIIVDSEEF